ncbi:speedy protein 1-B-like [Mixophyes fleayi]|uniref:speedy protein 1-B-like n=2 Tax=Mixophyes fleayi TaxID=3061075 RepID=UPI003F4DF77C
MDKRTTEEKLKPAKQIKLQEDQSQHYSADHSPSPGQEENTAFYKLLENKVIQDFLCADACMKISDKYLIAMVFAYFKRAGLYISEYTPLNFFIALYLANDMEEEEDNYHYEIFPWALGKTWIQHFRLFVNLRTKLFAQMKYRAVVSRRHCNEIMALNPTHSVWLRNRSVHHSGANKKREHNFYPLGPGFNPATCSRCIGDPESAASTGSMPQGELFNISNRQWSEDLLVIPPDLLPVPTYDIYIQQQTLKHGRSFE